MRYQLYSASSQGSEQAKYTGEQLSRFLAQPPCCYGLNSTLVRYWDVHLTVEVNIALKKRAKMLSTAVRLSLSAGCCGYTALVNCQIYACALE